MDIRNRLPPEFRNAAALQEETERASARNLAESHTRDPVAALLHLLTRLANCGLDAGAPPLLKSVRSEV